MMEPEAEGPTEMAFRQWIRTMEPLTPEQATRAQVIFRLAPQLEKAEDDATVSPGTSGISRALLSAAEKFRDVTRLPALDLAEMPEDATQTVRDELAARRNREAR